MDIMSLLARVALVLALVAFLSGFLITALSGSWRAVKIWLAVIAVIAMALTIVALVLSHNAFVYLMFQFVSLVIIFCFVVLAGAACGYGVYLLVHRRPPGVDMNVANADDFLPLAEFCRREGVPEERARARVASGYYTGGRKGGEWFIGRSELSSPGE